MERSVVALARADKQEALLFELAQQRCALPLGSVIELTRACAVEPLPSAPAFVLGVLNLRGSVLPVLDLRQRFGLPLTALAPSDYFVFARVGERRVALRVDRLLGIDWLPSVATAEAPNLPARLAYLSGVAAVADGVVLIYDLHSFLNDSEAELLDRALSSAAELRAGQP